MDSSTSILATKGLTKRFGGIAAVSKLDMDIQKGSIHAIIGPNGSGKTTFFNVITGLLPATEGRTYFEGDDITDRKPHVIARMGISRTFQSAQLALDLTVIENVMCGMYALTKKDVMRTFLHMPFTAIAQERRTRQESMQLLELVGLAGSAERWAYELVWVERQLLQMARALAAKPRLLLLDEPTGGMGSEESRMVEGLVRQVRSQLGMTIVVVAHDIRLVSSVSDWVTCIDFGEKIAEGTAEQVQREPRVVEAYLGKQ